ncbi:MAG: choice-of-anchor B family protein [Bacteroidetes bacterium]|nr:choice-of-anchor B family protein [Bacteroidota bacterium]
MKKFFFLLLTSYFSLLTSHAQYPSQNITLLSHWDTTTAYIPQENYYHIRYNSIWGWADTVKNREYAILGSGRGTFFIDVTTPAVPVVRAFVPGRRDSCIWREYKTYKNYLYAVSDDSPPNSIQIIDMSYLPDSVHVVYDQDTLAQHVHSIFIDEANARMYLNIATYKDGSHSQMAMCSLTNPIAPYILRKLEQDYPAEDNVHDCFVRNDTCYASCSYDGLHIYKYASNKFTEVGAITGYEPGGAYNHSSALTANGKTLIFADEVPANLTVKSLDVSNFSNLKILDKFKSTPATTATPHNPFIRNGSNSHVVIAYYADGVQIFDITNPSNVTRTGYFISSPGGCPTCPSQDYFSCWGVYIDLPSKIVLASDMQNGLFVLDAAAAMGVRPLNSSAADAQCYPNPFTANFEITFTLPANEKIRYELADAEGKTIMKKEAALPAGKTSLTFEGKNLPAGSYLLLVKGEKTSFTKKIIKSK